jgi:hypothetical protein
MEYAPAINLQQQTAMVERGVEPPVSSMRPRRSLGRNCRVFSARHCEIARDSKTLSWLWDIAWFMIEYRSDSVVERYRYKLGRKTDLLHRWWIGLDNRRRLSALEKWLILYN